MGRTRCCRVQSQVLRCRVPVLCLQEVHAGDACKIWSWYAVLAHDEGPRFLTDLCDDDEIGCKLYTYSWRTLKLACHEQEGLDFLADIHGDEEIEYNFLAGNEGIPAWDDRLKGLQDEFCAAFLHTSPDFQLGCARGLAPVRTSLELESCSSQAPKSRTLPSLGPRFVSAHSGA